MRGLHAAVLLAVAATSGWAAPAEAAPPKTDKGPVLVLRVEATAGLRAELVGKLDALVRSEVAKTLAGAKILPPPALDLESMKVAAGCSDDGPGCLASIGATLGAKDVLRTVALGTDARVSLALTFVHVKEGKAHSGQLDLEAAQGAPLALGDAAAAELREELQILLLDKRSSRPGSIALISSDGASLDSLEILLDDKKVALGALKSVPSGEHRVELHREGYEPLVWNGTVRPGRDTKIAATFTKSRAPGRAGEGATELASVDRAARDAPDRSLVPVSSTTPAPARPSVLYTWIFAGSAAVATGVGLYFWARQSSLESQLQSDCDPTTIEGRLVCRNSGYVSCAANPDRAECKEGRSSETATFIAFPVAGALAAAAVASFFLEDGPRALFGGSHEGEGRRAVEGGRARASEGEPGLVGGIVPLPGGVAATLGGRY